MRQTFFLVGAVKIALGEKVVECDSRIKLIRMKFDFANSAHYVLFQRDYKRGVVLIGDVQKFVRITDNLVFGSKMLDDKRFSILK